MRIAANALFIVISFCLNLQMLSLVAILPAVPIVEFLNLLDKRRNRQPSGEHGYICVFFQDLASDRIWTSPDLYIVWLIKAPHTATHNTHDYL